MEWEKGSTKGIKLTVSNSVEYCRRSKKDEDGQTESALYHQIATGTSTRRVLVEWWAQEQDSQVWSQPLLSRYEALVVQLKF